MIKRLWVWSGRRTRIEDDDMTPTQQAQAHLDRQQADGTHNPATQCKCGTWRTPGMPHVKNHTKLGPVLDQECTK